MSSLTSCLARLITLVAASLFCCDGMIIALDIFIVNSQRYISIILGI